MTTVPTSDSNDTGEVSPIPPKTRRLAVNVTNDALRQVRSGHPWVFDGSITRVKPPAGVTDDQIRPGDLAVIFDGDRKFAAIGLYDPRSPIRIRILHSGAPTNIDSRYFADRIASVAQLRLDAFDDSETNGFRLVHGENDGLPGLVVDRFADTAVIKIYSAAWGPYVVPVVEAVEEVLSNRPGGLRSVVLRLARSVAHDVTLADEKELADRAVLADGTVIFGPEPEDPVIFRENGLRFGADVLRGQKTGFFLDQRDNRRLVRKMALGLEVLDVFSSTGGFSVSAAAGGATSVLSVDISPWAVDAAERNMVLNHRIRKVRECHHETVRGDARETMERLHREGRSFGLVVVDPPSFASTQKQVAGALAAYGELTRLACGLVQPGGTLFQASCSARVDKIDFRQCVIESAHRGGYVLSNLKETGHALDHPVGFPQGEYLKGIFATVTRRR